MSLNSGEVEIKLDGKATILKPSLGAAIAISDRFGGFRRAIESVVSHDLSAIAYIVAQGTAASDLRSVTESVWRDLLGLQAPVLDYVSMLANGGRRIVIEEKNPPAAAA